MTRETERRRSSLEFIAANSRASSAEDRDFMSYRDIRQLSGLYVGLRLITRARLLLLICIRSSATKLNAS
jgi:hypothetical protein